ncbi:hypothetical protein OAV92_00485 [Crocinitomicaceae bacterium]|jgi:hypothetical protein|nr:hypothetical protein [Crocinitomicaceae bacterium]
MRLLLFKGAILFFGLSLCISVQAQSDDAVQYNNVSLDEDEETVLLSIKTTESFIVGANRYVLHIGGTTLMQNIHPEGRLDEIVFLIPKTTYQALEKGAEIVLVYGYYYDNSLQDGEEGQVSGYQGKHWKLGPFQPQELSK